MDKRISDMNTLGTPDDSDYIEVLDTSEILPDNKNKKMTLLTFKSWIINAFTLPQHKNTHVVGGTDAFLPTDLLDAIARFRIKLGNILTGERRGINFIPGSNVTITTLDDVINDQVNVTINATNNGGDVTNGANIGGQNEVFVNKTAGVLNYRTLRGTGVTTVTTNGNVLEINTPTPPDTANTIQNVGTGQGIWKQTIGDVHDLKSLVQGNRITITNNSNDLTISTTAQANTGSNIGESVEVYAGMNGEILQFRTLQGTGSITVNQVGNNIIINSNVLNYTLQNVGTGQGVYKNTTTTHNFKSLTSSPTITVVSSTDEISFNYNQPVYTVNKAIFADSVTGLPVAYNNVERVPGLGLKITGESFFNNGIPPEPDYIFEVIKPTITQLGVQGQEGAFQIDADGTYYFKQFRKLNSPDGLVYDNHFLSIENIGAGDGVSISANNISGSSNIITERGGYIGIGQRLYTFNNGVLATTCFINGVTQIPKLLVGKELNGNGKWLEFYTPEFTSPNYNTNYIHLSTINSETPGTIPNNPLPGIVNGKQGIRPPLAIHSSELQIRVGSTNAEAGGNVESPLQVTFTDKGVVFQPVVAATALNNSLFLDSITGKLSFKDSGGIVNALY